MLAETGVAFAAAPGPGFQLAARHQFGEARMWAEPIRPPVPAALSGLDYRLQGPDVFRVMFQVAMKLGQKLPTPPAVMITDRPDPGGRRPDSVQLLGHPKHVPVAKKGKAALPIRDNGQSQARKQCDGGD